MNFKKRTIAYTIGVLAALILTGCTIPFLSSTKSDRPYIPSTSYSSHPETTDDILQILTESMSNNQNSCEFLVSSETMINAEDWMSSLPGIDQIHCEYKKVSDGYNVLVTFEYWDNYAIVNAYKNQDTSLLNDRQSELYTKYLQIIDEYTSPSRSDCANELSIHDYLVTHIEYEEQEDTIYNAYDALIKGKSVCSGYAECFKTFMDLLGIENVTLSGTAGDQKHIWNMVCLEGEWYQVDVTWDDPIGSTDAAIDHAYFNITDTDMALDHTWDTSQNNGLTADGVKFSYPQYAGLIHIISQAQLNSYMITCIANQASSLEFTSSNTFDLKAAITASDTTLSYSFKIVERTGYSIYVVYLSY